MSAFIYALAMLIHSIINLYIWVIIIVALLSFVQPNPTNPTVRSLLIALYRLTEPLFSWIRQKMPFVLINGIDLSPLIVIFALQFLDTFLMKLLLG